MGSSLIGTLDGTGSLASIAGTGAAASRAWAGAAADLVGTGSRVSAFAIDYFTDTEPKILVQTGVRLQIDDLGSVLLVGQA